MVDSDTLAFSKDAAAAAKDRRLLDQLLMIMVVHSLLRNEGTDGDVEEALKKMARDLTVVDRRDDLSSFSKELFVITQRMLDAQLFRSLDGGEKEQEMLSSVGASAVIKNSAAAKKKGAAAAKKKWNKAAAKHKKTKLMPWQSLMMMAAFGSIATSAAFSLIPQSDGSSEGNDPPTLPPSASTSLGQRDIESIISPSPVPAVAVRSPIFSRTVDDVDDNNPPVELKSDENKKAVPTCSEDTNGWFDQFGYDCAWYAAFDSPGCPSHGNTTAHESSAAKGSANDHCCHCQIDVSNNVSKTAPPSSSEKCVDTKGWTNLYGEGCEKYQKIDDPGCPNEGNSFTGDMGPASENCCYCKNPTCEDFDRKCKELADLTWTLAPAQTTMLCDEAASCSCGADQVQIITNVLGSFNETVGLYNECKCDFWLGLCQDMQGGEACDYAAEYCCGDYIYGYVEGDETFRYLNSPQCYCDFYNYANNEFGHLLKPRALGVDKDFTNPCDGLEIDWMTNPIVERESLMAMYNATNGQNWTNNAGWTDGTTDHCLWYGIDCDADGHVVGIDLKDNNLSGQFPVYTRNIDSKGDPVLKNFWEYSKYGLANLYKLETLELANNKLTGTIEYRPLYNLRDLTWFDVSGNKLSGEVDALVAPSISYVAFGDNSFTSMRRFVQYKVSSLQTLQYCIVSSNAIQQNASVVLENIPRSMVAFNASNNQIYGNLPASLDTLPMLGQFIMASNALSGNLPAFTESFAKLRVLDLSKQKNGFGFTGSIPTNLWRFIPLKELNLAGNRLTGSIPPVVRNFAVLEVLDLSNNFMDSSLPPELGMLGTARTLKLLSLSNNSFTGTIPFQIGQLQGASVLLKDNLFLNTSTIAPLNLCLESEVNEFDLADDTSLCPPERNALSDFYDDAKGAEWTNSSLWLDEYASYCDWKGVTCDDGTNHVIKLNLTNNGLSGKLSKTIGNLTFMKELDLSDNNMKASLPAELGELSNLIYLRLSHNAFTGAVPESFSEIKGLQLLQLHDNRITSMPSIPRLNDDIYGESTFVADCGVPTDFDEVLKCDNCTMCCNANDDCHPQEKTRVEKWGLQGYMAFGVVLSIGYIVICCIAALLLYVRAKRKMSLLGDSLTTAMETRMKEDDMYALSKIGKDSVYSYFVTDNVFGWIAAWATLAIQIGFLVIFIKVSEANLQNDRTHIVFTWQCPRDSDVCENKDKLNEFGWVIFFFFMFAKLAKDLISGSKLIYHSTKVTHSLVSRIRYFFGGLCLCWFTLFALYVSTVYNKAIAISNTDIIFKAVAVLFVTEMDEWIFSTLEAINEDWTSHVALSEDETKQLIASQQEELRQFREIVLKKQEVNVSPRSVNGFQFEDDINERPLERTCRCTYSVDDCSVP